MLASAFVNDANPWLLLISSAVIIWLFIWGGIKMWHGHQAKLLRNEIHPLLQEVKDEQTRQATVIAEIHHEVNLNSGSSVKDAVVAIRTSQITTNATLAELNKKTDRIDKGLERHLGMHEGMAKVERA